MVCEAWCRGKGAFYVMYLDDNVRVLRNGSKPGSGVVVQVRRHCNRCAAVSCNVTLSSSLAARGLPRITCQPSSFSSHFPPRGLCLGVM